MISERLLHGVNTEHAPKEKQEEIIGALAHALDMQWLLMKGQDRSQEFLARIYEFVDLPLGIIRERTTRKVPILDYKPAPYPDKDSPRKNFFNDTFIFHGREEPLPFGEVITEVPAAVFHNGAFYTGDHHNHILPKMEILFDKDGGMRKAFDAFRSALQEEFDFASKMANNGRTVDGVHIMDRAPVFSPQTVEEARGLFAQ